MHRGETALSGVAAAPTAHRAVPVAAATLALADVLAAVLAPVLLVVLVPLSLLAACAPALRTGALRRRVAIALIAVWLFAALAGAWWLRDATTISLAWILIVLFAAPLVLIPWLFARTFEVGR